MDATWVLPSQQNEAEEKGYVVVAPESVLATHLSQIFYKHSGKLIGQDDVQTLLDNLSQTAPSLVESLVPKLVPLHNLTGVLRELLSERVPISDLRIILESLAGLVGKNLSVIETAEAIRPNLAGLLIQQVAPLNKALPVITFNSELEHMLIKMAKQNGEEGLVLDNELATKLISNISDLNQKLVSEGNTAVLVVSPNIRRQISGIIRQHVEDLIVLSFTELPDNRKVNVVATIDGGS
jgi:flagellar biosynthesis protein FlhA